MKNSPRKTYIEDEAKYPWLKLLLNAFHIVDEGIKSELKKEEIRRNQKVACKKRCSNCCLRAVIPLNPLESQGISWYVSEKLQNPVRQDLKKQLLTHSESTVCPFLVSNICSIYTVRPLACRTFFIFGTECLPEKDPLLERRKDIWSPSTSVAEESAYAMMPHFGIKLKDRKLAFEEGFMVQVSRPMHELNLTEFCRAMEIIDEARHS